MSRREWSDVQWWLLFWAVMLLTVVYMTQQPRNIQEDDPRWDCATMGNRICGDTEIGNALVIYP